MKQDNSSFIVVTTKAESARIAIYDSPFQRTLVTQGLENPDKPKRVTWGALYNVHSTITSPVNPIPTEKTGGPPPSSSEGSDTAQKTFTIHCFSTAKDFDHNEGIKQDPLNGPWPDSGGVETYISALLRQTVPSGHMAPGLRDWETGRQMSRDSGSFVDEEVYGAAATILGKQRFGKQTTKDRMGHILERMRIRKSQDEIPEVMNSLTAYVKKVRSANPDQQTSGRTPLGLFTEESAIKNDETQG